MAYSVRLYIFSQVAQLSKFREGGGLGISLEGTVDVENGIEVRPHHYIRSILHDGPVGFPMWQIYFWYAYQYYTKI
jgi:hypothetical protein